MEGDSRRITERGKGPHRHLLAPSRLCPLPRASCSRCPARLGRLSGHPWLPERTRRVAHPRGADLNPSLSPDPTVAPTPPCPGLPVTPAPWAALRAPLTNPAGIPASRRPCPGTPAPAVPSPAPAGGRREPRPQPQGSGGGRSCARTGPGTFQGRRGLGRAPENPLPVTCSLPGGDTARPSSGVEPCGQRPPPPSAIPAGERPRSPHSLRGAAGAASGRTPPQPRTAGPEAGPISEGTPGGCSWRNRPERAAAAPASLPGLSQPQSTGAAAAHPVQPRRAEPR